MSHWRLPKSTPLLQMWAVWAQYEHLPWKTNVCISSQSAHPTENGNTNQITCLNYHGPHPANSRSCEKFKQEKQVINCKGTENISFLEARKRFALFSRRYADAARWGAERRLVLAATQYSEADFTHLKERYHASQRKPWGKIPLMLCF